MSNNRTIKADHAVAGPKTAAERGRQNQPVFPQRQQGSWIAQLAASTGLCSGLVLAGLTASVAVPSAAQAAVVSACSGVQLPASVLRDNILRPVTEGIVGPVQGTLNPLLGVVNTLLSLPLVPIGTVVPGNLSIDVEGILDNVNNGQPLTIQALDTNGQLVGPGDDCRTTADGFQLDTPAGIAIGGNAITGLGAGGGVPASAAEIDAIALGDGASTGAGAAGAMALGTGATVGAGAAGGLALGAGAETLDANSVALGAGSATTVGAQTGYSAFGLAAPQTSLGEVNVGNRTLSGLAAGAEASDAVNVAQLDGVAVALAASTAALGSGAAYDPETGAFTAPSYVLNGGTLTVATVGEAIDNLDGRTTTNTTDITNLTTQIGNGTVGLVQQAAAGADLTVGAATDGDAVVFNQAGGGTRLVTGLTAGSVAAGSTDAVTGGQLAATNDAVAVVGTGLSASAAAFGSGAAYDPATGTFTSPSYVLNGGTLTVATVGEAIDNLDGRTTTNTTDITNLTTQIGNGTVGLVQQAAAGADLTVGAATDGDAVAFNQAGGGTRLVTGLSAGTVAAGSTDAVTGGQLAATNDSVAVVGTGLSASAAAFGSGAGYDPATGAFTAPSYVLNGGTLTVATVGEAIDNLDGRTSTNTADITNLTTQIGNGTVGLVQQSAPGAGLTVGAATDGDSVAFNQAGGGTRRITGVSNGAIAAGSTDAVTGGQLAATNDAVSTVGSGLSASAQAFGSGAAYDPATGLFTAPSYVLNGGTLTVSTVGEAIDNLDGRTTTNTTDISNLTTQVGNGTVGLVQQSAPGAGLTVGAATDGDAVAFNQAGGSTRLVTGLSAGSVAAGSTDAVTGGQLAATNDAVAVVGAGLSANAAALGGGAGFDPVTGAFTAPSYVLNGGTLTVTTVGDAIGNLDGRVSTNSSDIANLNSQVSNGTVGLVQQAAPGADLTVGAATDGDAVAFNQAGGATRIVTGLSDGAVTAGSTDAVTGGQAFATGQSIASALGGGAAVAADGTIAGPRYTISGTEYASVGSAFAAVDNSLTALENQVSAFDPDGTLAFVSVNTSAGPARATATETVAVGGGAVASGANASAYGSNAVASGGNASAFGAGSSAGYSNSSAFGAGATATRDNQIALGTATSTYTLSGITSTESRAAQRGPLDVVTTDAAGNLGSLPLSDIFSGMSAIENRIGDVDRRLDKHSEGIAIAMALGAVNLPADKSFAMTGSVGYFDDSAALGIGAIGQVSENVYLNGGIGIGTENGTVAGRAGLTVAW